MRVVKPLALGILTRPIEFQRRFFLGIAAISFCPISDTPGLLGEIAMWKYLAETLPPTMPLDLGFPKTAGEFLAHGSAFAPGGRPVTTVTVGIRLGSVAKRLVAVGDRHFEDGRSTQPVPFVEMPMGWDRAYGGSKVAENPLGVGTEEKPLQGIGFRIPLPNVAPAEAGGAPRPLGFGPIDIAWPQRTKLAGTHDKRWLEEEFPGFARDIDFRMFMAASPDQRFEGFLRGDEDYEIQNMHPEQPKLLGRLPGLLPRALVQRRGRTALEDVPLNCTTVWFFPAHKRLVMLHHGRVVVEEEDARDIEILMLGADRLGEKRPVADFQAQLAKRLDPEWGVMEAMRDSALVPAELIIPDPDLAPPPPPEDGESLTARRANRRLALEQERTNAQLIAQGEPPIQFPPQPPAQKAPTLDELPALLEKLSREAEEKQREAEAKKATAAQEAVKLARAAGEDVEETPEEKKPFGPPPFSARALWDQLAEHARALEAEGADASEIRAMLTDRATIQSWRDAEEKLREAYLLSANAQDRVPPLDPAANAALLARLFDGSRNARRANLCGANLAGADLSGFDLTEAWLDSADLTGANLSRARLERSVLAHATLDGARLAGADLTGANLGGASLQGTDLSAARLNDTMLIRSDFRRADLRRADLRGAMMVETQFAGCDLSDAQAPDLVVNEVSLAGMRAIGANLETAAFLKADLSGADFSGANLRRATFLGVTAPGLIANGADLSRAVFVTDCDLTGIQLTGARCVGANFRGSKMAGAALGGALLDDSDFSDADLSGAFLDLACARRARFVVTDLRGATMTRADFAGASFARADLRGADLSDASLYEVDLGRIQADSATRYERVQRTRTKLVPRRVPA